jgi:RimJ/RimL family protein N-acetyltransferase
MKQYRFYGWKIADIKEKHGLTPRDCYDLLSGIWCAGTCAPRMRENWTPENKTLGQCSITAFLLQDLYGGRVYGVPLSDGNFHCFNVVDGCTFDLTSEQFGDTALDYADGPEQFRETHFAKEEKRLRYEDLKARFFACLPKIIETDRLILRPFTEGDAADLLEYLKTPAVNCFMDMRLPTLAAAKRAVKKRMREKEYDFAVALKDTGKVIGEFFGEPEGTAPGREPADTFSPCWMLNLNYTGKGYAYEAAHAFFDYLFNEKEARRIYAYTEDYNTASQRLCERLGMRREGLFLEFISFVNNPDGTPHYENTYQYAILKKEWK